MAVAAAAAAQLASQDSDVAQIGTNADGPDILSGTSGPSETTAVAGENGGNLKRMVPLSGHHDPRQRRAYLFVFLFSITSALTGLVLIIVWMLKFRATPGFGFTDKGQLANVHPLLMYTFMVSLNMYSVLIYRTHYELPKQRLKWIHASLSIGNIIMSLIGVYCMYKAHLMGGMANFYSLHSWIGVTTNGFYLAQLVAGLLAFLKPGLSQQRRAALMPWHRLAGAMILVLAAASALTGITELVIFQDQKHEYAQFSPITFVANFAGIAVVLTTASSIYLLTAHKYLRPALPEEAPLNSKR